MLASEKRRMAYHCLLPSCHASSKPLLRRVGGQQRQLCIIAPYIQSGGILVGWVEFTLKPVGSSHFALEPWPTTPHQVTTLRRSHCYDALEGTPGSCQNRIEDQQRGREGGFALAIQFGEFCLAFPVSNTNSLFLWRETKIPLLLELHCWKIAPLLEI